MSRCWVAGATGFLGGHVAAELIERGFDVTLCSKSGGELSSSVAQGRRVESVDVLDAEAVSNSAVGAEYAIVAVGAVSRREEDAAELYRVHVQGTKSVLRGLRDAGVRRVVYASTSGTIAVGTDPNQIFDESAPDPLEYIARWPYYRSKLFAEREALVAQREGEFEVVVVNPSLLLGPGDERESSTKDVRLFLEQRIAAVPRGGLAFVDVRDVAQTMVNALQRGRAGERYLLNAKNLTVQAWFERLERLSGVPAPRLRLPRQVQIAREGVRWFNSVVERMGGKPVVDAVSVDMAQHYWYCRADKAIRELGFEPRDPSETLRDTVRDLVERGRAFPRTGHFRGGSSANATPM